MLPPSSLHVQIVSEILPSSSFNQAISSQNLGSRRNEIIHNEFKKNIVTIFRNLNLTKIVL